MASEKEIMRASADLASVAIEHAALMLSDAQLTGASARSNLLEQAAALLAFALADFTRRHGANATHAQQRAAALAAVAVFFDGPPTAASMSKGGQA